MEVNTTGEIKHLIVKKRILHGNYAKQWESLYNDYHKRFGATPEFTEHLMKMKEAIILRAEIAEEFDQALKWDLDKIEREIEEYGKEGEAMDFQKANAALSKFMGGGIINTRTTSTAEWYGARAQMEKAIKESRIK